MQAADDAGAALFDREQLTQRFLPFQECSHVAVAVSGGSDSVALMHMLSDWMAHERNSGRRLTVLTVDHQLRPGSMGECEMVARWAVEIGAPHVRLEWQGDKPATGVQEAAREARYGLMTDWCIAHEAAALFVAHTLDDQAETLVMRLARGSGVDGLAGMAPVSVRDGVTLARPLLDVARAALRYSLAARGGRWIDDPSNDDRQFERVRVRQMLPKLAELGLTMESLAQTARRAQRARIALDAATARAMQRYVEVDPAGHCRVGREAFVAENEEIRMRLLSRCLRAVGGNRHPVADASVARLAGALCAQPDRSRTLGGCRIVGSATTFLVARETGRRAGDAAAVEAGRPSVWDGRFKVVARVPDSKRFFDTITVRPLRAQGWDIVKKDGHRCKKLVREGLVSFWCADRLVCVPHLGYRADDICQNMDFSAEFCNMALLEGARVADR